MYVRFVEWSSWALASWIKAREYIGANCLRGGSYYKPFAFESIEFSRFIDAWICRPDSSALLSAWPTGCDRTELGTWIFYDVRPFNIQKVFYFLSKNQRNFTSGKNNRDQWYLNSKSVSHLHSHICMYVYLLFFSRENNPAAQNKWE